MRQRIEWLDVMKGIAIILVVLGHMYNSMNLFSHPVNLWLHLFHMPFFFILSGFLAIKTTNRNLIENIKNKFITLIIPFIVGGSIFSLTMEQSLNNYIFDLHHCGYWFLFSLFTCWIIFLPIQVFTRKCPNILKIIILIIPFFLGNLLMKYLPEYISASLSFPLSFSYYRFFILGYIIGIVYNNIKFKEKIKTWVSIEVIFMISFMIFFIMTVCIITIPNNIRMIPTTILQFMFCITLFSILLFSKRIMPQKIFSILCYIGKNSLALYVFHFYLVYLFPISPILNFSPGIQTLVVLLLTITVIVATLALATPFKKTQFYLSCFLDIKLIRHN